MESLFEEDEPQSSPEEPEAEVLPQEEYREDLSQLAFHLRRFGVTKRLSQDVLEKLDERLVSQPLKLLKLGDNLEVDEYLWNYVNIRLQEDTEASEILEELENWSFYKEKKQRQPVVDQKIQAIHFYKATKDIPAIVYCANKRKFSREFTASSIDQVSEIRYQLVLEKTKLSNPDVTPVDAVSRVSKYEQLVIGIIGLNKKGDVCLQGSLAELPMIIDRNTIIKNGIYCDSHTVLVRCIVEQYKEHIRCIEISHPPLQVDIPLPDFFGGRLSRNEHEELAKVKAQKEEAGESEQWVIISDIHLDNDAAMQSLESLLSTLLSMYQHQGFPVGIVLMGNFMSSAFATVKSTYKRYQQGFERLYRLLASPRFRVLLMSCYFVLVPGVNDATLCNQLLPMEPLIVEFTANIKERMDALLGTASKFISMSNPCRIRHLTTRMLFCRNDLLNRLLSSAIITRGSDNKITPPSELKEMLFNTVLGQGHLNPNKPGVHTVLKHDPALLLYPTPDLICLGDNSCPSFIVANGSTTFCNVESFSISRSFIIYDAISGRCQKLAL